MPITSSYSVLRKKNKVIMVLVPQRSYTKALYCPQIKTGKRTENNLGHTIKMSMKEQQECLGTKSGMARQSEM